MVGMAPQSKSWQFTISHVMTLPKKVASISLCLSSSVCPFLAANISACIKQACWDGAPRRTSRSFDNKNIQRLTTRSTHRVEYYLPHINKKYTFLVKCTGSLWRIEADFHVLARRYCCWSFHDLPSRRWCDCSRADQNECVICNEDDHHPGNVVYTTGCRHRGHLATAATPVRSM